MKKLINSVESVLQEQIKGLVEAHPELALHQEPLFITRADAPVKGKVALMSGGAVAMNPCIVVLSAKVFWMGLALVRFSPHRRQIKCMSVAKPLMAGRAC